tara:strand:+ start:369 stop:521 length:153 start_codon:yes stop_codon:yes gene_type:complete
MDNVMTARLEMIGDDTPMASPPHGLGTHERDTTIIRECFDIRDCRSEFVA